MGVWMMIIGLMSGGWTTEASEQKRDVFSEVASFLKKTDAAKTPCQTCRTFPAARDEGAFPAHRPPPKRVLLVFLSLSLPDAILKEMAAQAPRYPARLVIRGLVNTSVQVTQKRLQDLQMAVEIDPFLFEQFQVTRVPTFVWAQNTVQGVQTTGHDRLEGNVPLPYVWEQFQRRGSRP